MKFKSQICTSKSQSEALLKLGLKKETADMVYSPYCVDGVLIDYFEPQVLHGSMREYIIQNDESFKDYIPAWSLSRLIEMMPFRVGKYNHLGVIVNKEDIEIIDLEEGTVDIAWEKENVYDNIHDCIEWLIKEGYFNKEYLV